MGKISLLAVAAVLTIPAVVAHEVKLADRSVDYTDLVSPTGKSCCGGHDCAPTESRWLPDGTLEIKTALDTWAAVPPEVIIWELPEALWGMADVTHACWRGHPLNPSFYCVFPHANES